MPKDKKKKNDGSKTFDNVIKIILIIIIIILLLHNCVLMKKNKENEEIINVIDITNDKCKQDDGISIDCLKESDNSTCLVPNFVGKTKKEFLKWLNSISNTIEIEIKLVKNSKYPDGTILSQSITGVSVKDLLEKKTKLVITIVNNGSMVDCVKNSKNSKCVLPDFVGKNVSDVEDWVDGIANHFNIKYEYIDSDKPSGTVIKQSLKKGTKVKDIIEQNQTLIIYVSKDKNSTNPLTSGRGNNTNNNTNNNNNNGGSNDNPITPTPEPDGDFYVSDNEKVRWQSDSDLKIFEDSTTISKVKGTIAPESTGSYKFIVHNETRYNLKYKISFDETNDKGMNMKYKLKKGNTYIVDHYVSYNELGIDNQLLNTSNSDIYYLEWKWVSSDNDTSVGKAQASYNLKIKVEAESTNG